MAQLRYHFPVFFEMMILVYQTSGMQTIKLSSGYEMPIVGLGTWQLFSKDVDAAVTSALKNGIYHIDTAFIYGNEVAIGKSLKKYFDNGGKREDLFITTKRLGLTYVDMYLIHFPMGLTRKSEDIYQPAWNQDGSIKIDESTNHVATWKAMEAQVKAGRARSIGLSNFNKTQALKVINHADIKPSNLQIELQAYNQQKELVDFCEKHGITVTGYSTLGSPGSRPLQSSKQSVRSLPKLLEHPVVQTIAQNHRKSTAQVLLRHSVQNNIIVIPKSKNPVRIRENIDIFDFELTSEEMKELDGLDKGEDGRLFDMMFFKGLEKHPEYPFQDRLKKVQTDFV